MELKETGIECFMAVPDFISLLNLSFGFFAILMAINNQISISAIFIIVALIFDSIDGWVARKLSRVDKYGFGKNIDSLSDVVSFAAAPGILLYCTGINYLGVGARGILNNQFFDLTHLLAIVALFIVISGVTRLARFNVLPDKEEFNYYVGAPIPTTAVILAAFILSGIFNIYWAMIIMVIMGILMLSNIKYTKLKNPIYLLIIAILTFLMIIPYSIVFGDINIPATMVLILTLAYVFIELFRGLFASNS